MTVREELHKLIDTLADDQIADLRQYIDELRGEVTKARSQLFGRVSMTSSTVV